VVRCAWSRYPDRNSGWCSSLLYSIMPGTQQFWMAFLYSLTKWDRYLWTMSSRLLLQWEAVQVMQVSRAQQDPLPWVQYCTNALCTLAEWYCAMLCRSTAWISPRLAVHPMQTYPWLPVPHCYKAIKKFLRLCLVSKKSRPCQVSVRTLCLSTAEFLSVCNAESCNSVAGYNQS